MAKMGRACYSSGIRLCSGVVVVCILAVLSLSFLFADASTDYRCHAVVSSARVALATILQAFLRADDDDVEGCSAKRRFAVVAGGEREAYDAAGGAKNEKSGGASPG